MRERARAVVIGGGVGGCSVLYHLAKLGWTDSVLVEQYELTHGSTWHSAGLVGQLRSSVSLTRMMMYSVGLYGELERETGTTPAGTSSAACGSRRRRRAWRRSAARTRGPAPSACRWRSSPRPRRRRSSR